jgi:hypothetical protein
MTSRILPRKAAAAIACLAATPVAAWAGEVLDCGAEQLIQHVNGSWVGAGGCIDQATMDSRWTSWARAFPMDHAFDVQCVECRLKCSGPPFEVTVNLLTGDPTGPYLDLSVLATRTVLVASSPQWSDVLVSFAADGGYPVVAPGETLVVEVIAESRLVADGGDGGSTLMYFNQQPQTGDSYIRSEFCGGMEFRTTEELVGLPAWSWALSVHGTSRTCGADLDGDGAVGGSDLGALLAAWGIAPGSAADLTGDGRVDGADLGSMLSAWGGCG